MLIISSLYFSGQQQGWCEHEWRDASSMRLETMGFLDRLANFLGLRKAECSVIVVGLDNSGKSTLLNHFKPEEDKHADIVPTVGFNVEKFKSKTIFFLNSLSICFQHVMVLFWAYFVKGLIETSIPSSPYFSLFIHKELRYESFLGNKGCHSK